MKTCVLHPDRKAITTAAHIPVCRDCDLDYHAECIQYLPFAERHFYRRLLEAVPERSRAMEESAWRVQYAPHGFIYSTRQIDFMQLEEFYDIKELIAHEIQCLHDILKARLLRAFVSEYDEARAFTRISVFPKQIGESLNHLDRLGLRMGIEIEIRWPASGANVFRSVAMMGGET